MHHEVLCPSSKLVEILVQGKSVWHLQDYWPQEYIRDCIFAEKCIDKGSSINDVTQFLTPFPHRHAFYN